MCGIAGFYGFRNDDLIKKFSRRLAHRGPDGEGFDIEKNISLLNRRLAIIDLKSGDQPVYNEDKSISVVFNGEIYNYQELRDLLRRKKHKFKTRSDSEVIAHAYEEWGEACFDLFNGMFTIAIHDKKAARLILSRDHFGIKPLYYTIFRPSPKSKRRLLMFSSEIKPLIESGLIEKKPNDRIIYRYLKYRIHDDQRETFFSGINRLLPGEMLIAQGKQFKISKFSDLEEELVTTPDADGKVGPEQIKIFKNKLNQAIKLRLISDVSVGTALSGGLDSSTVVASVARLLDKKSHSAKAVGKKQKSFSAVFPAQNNDEEVYVDALLDSIKKVESFKVYPKPEELIKDLRDFVLTQEEPTISTGPYAQYRVMKLASQHVKVLLDGQGADEFMAGYLPYYFVYLRQLLKQEKYWKFIWESICSLDIIIKYAAEKLAVRLGITQVINPSRLMKDEFAGRYKKEKYEIPQDNLKKRLVDDIFRNSLPSLLRYEDKNSMRFSIEGRVPFIDFNLLRYIFSLSDETIIKSGWNKYILRQAIRGLLPELIRKRRNKIGFTTPEYAWFHTLTPDFYKIFLSESFAGRKYFDQKDVLKSFQKFIDGKVGDTMVFWRLISLELWLKEFFDGPPATKSGPGTYRPLFPNQNKKIKITAGEKTYYRFPVRTEVFNKGSNYRALIARSVKNVIDLIPRSSAYRGLANKSWLAVVSEKAVGIAQGRSYFLWEIEPSFMARFLSKYVSKSSYGIGLASPFTMELAIREVGLIKILSASLAAAITKPLGLRGVFYRVAGPKVRSIDGPTEHSLFPANASATLGPGSPQKAAEQIAARIKKTLPKKTAKNFLGAAIIDANDIGQNILGNATELSDRVIEQTFADNPLGQGSEQTPVAIVFEN